MDRDKKKTAPHARQAARSRAGEAYIPPSADRAPDGESLPVSEQKFRHLFEATQNGIFLLDGGSGVILEANPFLETMLGYPRVELVGKKLWQAGFLGSAHEAQVAYREMQKQDSFRIEKLALETRDGHACQVRLISNRYQVDGRPIIQCDLCDLTELSQAQETLVRTNASWQSLVDNTSDLVTVIDINGAIRYQNQAVERVLGYPHEEFIGKNAAEFIQVDDMARAWQVFGTSVPKTRSEYPTIELQVRHRDGTWRTMETTGEARQNEAGQLEAVLISRDITERKQAEQALRVSEERFRRLTQVTFEGIVIHDGRQVLDANPAVLSMFGYQLSEVIGKNLLEFVAPESHETILNGIRSQLEKPIEAFGRRKDGSIFALEVIGKAIPNLGTSLRVTAMHDITERRLADEQIQILSRISAESPNPILRVTQDGIVLYANATSQPVLQAWNTGVGQTLPEEVRKRVIQVALDQQNEEFEIACGDRMFSFILAPIREAGYVNVYGRDITERWQARALQDSIYQIAVAAEATGSLAELYPRIHAIISSVMPAENFYITLYDEKQNLLQFPYFRDSLDEPYIDAIEPGMGLTAYVLRTGKSLLCDEVLHHELEQQGAVKLLGVPSKIWLGVPLIIAGKTIGAMVVQHYTDANAYSVREQQMLEFVSSQVGSAIIRKQAEAEIRNRLADLEAINRISTALRGARTVDEMLPLLLDETLKIVGTDVGDIWLFDTADHGLRQTISRGWLAQIQAGKSAPGAGIAGYVLQTGQPYTSADLSADTRFDSSVLPDIRPGWGGICVPIRAEQTTVGVLCIYVENPRQLGQEDIRLLSTISEIAGNAIRRVRLYEQTLHQVQRLAALRSMDTAISSVLDLRMVLDILLGHIVGQLNVDAADVLLLNPPTHTLEFAAARGFRSGEIEKSHLRLDEGFAGRAAREKTLVNIPDLTDKTVNFTRLPLLSAEDFITYYGVPLITKGQVRGVLEIFQRSTLHPDADWLGFLETLASQAAIAVDNSQLFENLQNSNYELMMAYDETIEGWSQAMDMRDKETQGHSRRVTEITMKLAESLGCSSEELVHIRRGALLHDIGKLGVPDEILRKTGPLGEEDWVHMKKHPQLAHDMLAPIRYLHPALDIPYCHHERWDGSGYPRGLVGEQIPLAARIFAVVDVWDALTSDRPYRKAWSGEKALAYIKEQSGHFFDPVVVDTFLREIITPGHAPIP